MLVNSQRKKVCLHSQPCSNRQLPVLACTYSVHVNAAGARPSWREGREQSAYREEGLNDVCFDGAEGLVFDDDEDLLLFFQVYEVTEPRFLGKSA